MMLNNSIPWQQVREGMTSKGFWWITGFEGSNIPQMEADEYLWTQHYQNWRQDLTLVKERLQLKYLRYTFPWYKINPAPGKFKWDWADQVVAQSAELGLNLILNPIQFGTPSWLEDSFGNPDYPNYATEYIRQLAQRYGNQIKYYTPHNEPLISALFGGDLGHWPPYWQGLDNYVKLVENISRQIVLSVKAIKAEVPDAVMIHVEAGEYYATRSQEKWLQADVEFRNERRFIIYDLISGRINLNHPLTEWLQTQGMSRKTLYWFQEHAIELDVVGVDFYPHCEAWLEWENGEIVQYRDHGNSITKAFEATRDSALVKQMVDLPLSLSGLLHQYYDRYGCPVILTETDYSGLDEHKSLYLEYSIQEIKRLRTEGVPVIGYTWWPAIDHLNWNNALKERGTIHPVGLWKLKPQIYGNLKRVETESVEVFRKLITQSDSSVGDVAMVYKQF